MNYEMIWRNKWTTANATSIDDMIGALMRSIEELQEMKKDKIEGDFQGAEDDYIFFRTTNFELAQKYGMYEDLWEEEEYDEEELMEEGQENSNEAD